MKDIFEFAEWVGRNKYVYWPSGEWGHCVDYSPNSKSLGFHRIAKDTDELYLLFLKERD